MGDGMWSWLEWGFKNIWLLGRICRICLTKLKIQNEQIQNRDVLHTAVVRGKGIFQNIEGI